MPSCTRSGEPIPFSFEKGILFRIPQHHSSQKAAMSAVTFVFLLYQMPPQWHGITSMPSLYVVGRISWLPHVLQPYTANRIVPVAILITFLHPRLHLRPKSSEVGRWSWTSVFFAQQVHQQYPLHIYCLSVFVLSFYSPL